MASKRNITRRKRWEERLNRINSEFLTLGQDYDANLNMLTALCGELLDADCSLYSRLDGDLLCVRGKWNAPADMASSDAPRGHICFDVIQQDVDQPMVVRHLQQTDYARTDPNVVAYGLSTYVGYPVRFGGRTRGSLCAVYTRDREPSADDLQVVGILAMAIAQEEARAEAVRALQSSETLVRDIIDNVDEAILLIDRDYRIVTANRIYCQWAGLSLADIVGRPCYEVSHHLGRPCHEEGRDCVVNRTFDTGESGVILFKSEDDRGNRSYVEKRAFPVRDAAGDITTAIETVRNVTDRYLLETERLKTQKLEAIGTLAGGIAHDFNNLLQGVFGYLSLARMNLEQTDKARAMLEQAEKALQMSVNLTSQMLTFAKGGRPVKKRLALLPVIENAARFALSGSRSDYRLSIDDDLLAVEADEGQMGQVIQNVVLNASEAMPDGGTITISAGNVEIPRGADPSLPEGGKFVRITIQDPGIGIPEKYLSKIFDPYFTTKQKGSGLGLATSYSIIRNHGGSISVGSRPGQGAAFFIYVPACVPAGERPQPVVPAGGRTGRILIMDDEEMIRSVAAEMIEALGHEAETARDGLEAIDKYLAAKKSGRPFDVVILDLTVKGGLGGEETIGKLRALDPSVVAVVSSGYADNPVVADHRAYGFSALLSKPYEIDSLRDSLNTLLR
ncbi:MAG: ATP-binding protein [Nitrospiraceae bacterium]|nr:ATP-binding protein [Nitrospiraceae bacterium]